MGSKYIYKIVIIFSFSGLFWATQEKNYLFLKQV